MYVIKHSFYKGMLAEYENYEDAKKDVNNLNVTNTQNLWYVDGANMRKELIFRTYNFGRIGSKFFNSFTDLLSLPHCMKFKTVQKDEYYSFSVIYNVDDKESVKVVEALKTIAQALYVYA